MAPSPSSVLWTATVNYRGCHQHHHHHHHRRLSASLNVSFHAGFSYHVSHHSNSYIAVDCIAEYHRRLRRPSGTMMNATTSVPMSGYGWCACAVGHSFVSRFVATNCCGCPQHRHHHHRARIADYNSELPWSPSASPSSSSQCPYYWTSASALNSDIVGAPVCRSWHPRRRSANYYRCRSLPRITASTASPSSVS